MIELSGINLRFKDKTIFEGFNFFVDKGEKVVLRAPSGQGKTSLLHIIMGFLRPDSGTVKIGGDVLKRSTVDDIRRRICYIGQDVSLPGGRAGDLFDEISSFAVNRHKDFSRRSITAQLEKVSLPESVLNKKVEDVSGGERRRLAYTACVLMNRDIWLLDEISAGLDDMRKRAVMDDVAANDKTVVVVSHDDAWLSYSVRSVIW